MLCISIYCCSLICQTLLKSRPSSLLILNRFPLRLLHCFRIQSNCRQLFKTILDGLLTHISSWSLNSFYDFHDSDTFDNFRYSSINWVDTSENVANQHFLYLCLTFLIMPVSQNCSLDAVLLGRNSGFMFFKPFWIMSEWEGALSKKSKTFLHFQSFYYPSSSRLLAFFQLSSKL